MAAVDHARVSAYDCPCLCYVYEYIYIYCVYVHEDVCPPSLPDPGSRIPDPGSSLDSRLKPLLSLSLSLCLGPLPTFNLYD